MNSKYLFLMAAAALWSISAQQAGAQEAALKGKVIVRGRPEAFVNVYLKGTQLGDGTDSSGAYQINHVPPGTYELVTRHVGFKTFRKEINLSPGESLRMDIDLSGYRQAGLLDDIVVTGTMKPVSKRNSPVPVEVYHKSFFKKNASPDLFDALQNINGVRPQINCNVCNTGDIHINGLEGPYTMVLIDGMPIVSALGTVYGFSGIPSALIDRIEVVKGPASSLYGSESMGGTINIITQDPAHAPVLSADLSASTWGEYNTDLSFKLNAGKRAHALTGINYFNFQNKIDKDGDGFTDKTLQNRISLFHKWSFQRKHHRIFTLAGRYLYEDRWGGDMRWNKAYRGGDEVYGESIYTNRFVFIGNYQLPTIAPLFFQFSFIDHDQDSRYGDESYKAHQKIAFGQLRWDKKIGINDFLAGIAMRYTFYDDNTPATATQEGLNHPEKTRLPGIFVQDELTLSKQHSLLLGMRYDYNNIHGSILTPRLAYKWRADDNNTLRLNAGTGYRVVNVFSEDHAALTGGRDVVILHDLKPEQSYNVNLNYVKHIIPDADLFMSVDAAAFYTYFTNRIVPDYETDPTKIIYDNLNGHSVSKGLSLNLNLNFTNGLDLLIGGTWLRNTVTRNGITAREMKAESFDGTWAASYEIAPWHLTVDYTGNVVGPMRLPLQGDLDPRPEYSPWFSIQNIQFTYKGLRRIELYAGVKNLLNWTVGKATRPFLIARPQDPFDRQVAFDHNGHVIPAANNPYGLVFDPDSYAYGTNQGIRGFAGIRFSLK